MMRSLFSGVSGLRSHQVRMDVIGNNVANVNTVGYKAGRMTFKEGFSQLIQGATRATENSGGINPLQIGLGTQVGSVDMVFTQGSMESTGIKTDLGIQGESFFAVRQGNQQFYTRAGNFQLDSSGRLVSASNGFVVQGRMANNGELSGAITDIKLPFGEQSPAKSTEKVNITGNLNASATAGPTSRAETSISVYDSLGNKHELTVEMEKTGDNAWSWKVISPTDPSPATGSGAFSFNADGTMVPIGAPPTITFAPTGADPMSMELELGAGGKGLTQFAGSSTAALRDQDGYPMGTLEDFSIDARGTIVGSFSNGLTVPIAQLALVDFNNPGGLVRQGDNMYAVSPNSGTPVIGYSGEGTASSIMSGALEMSNVDLAAEFTNMIIAQRGFQANSRMISNADEMLQEVVNLKR